MPDQEPQKSGDGDARSQNAGTAAESRTCHFCGHPFSGAVCPACASNMRQAGAKLLPHAAKPPFPIAL